ncbi:cytochrome ubiquinol oxidase subunit I [Streptosporangium oxazolinicum]|uniref:Cytochrome ubiquinol oxidase subunit I n=1 Tax=Streptosporangium oxazolinicum TaxID=909287 RepID=A0ABP8AWI9_9ACTN
MEPLDLARLEFALTTSLHFLFVALTLGLAPLILYMQARWVFGGRPVYERMTRFWGQIYLVNYALGIVTGIVMEFQFGLNWSGLTKLTGDVFGAAIALETLVAFFLESTFLGLWIFGWHRLPRIAHLAVFAVVTLTAYASAFFIMVSNSFMQHPVGYERHGAGIRLTDFGALVSNPALTVTLAHLLPAALSVGAFFVAGVSAHHFIRRTRDVDFFRRSMRVGLVVAAVTAPLVMAGGIAQFPVIGGFQPVKTALTSGNAEELAKAQSLLAARFGPGDLTPPTWIYEVGQVMIYIGQILALSALLLLPLMVWRWSIRLRPLLYVMTFLIPLPFVAAVCGWLVREVGRQPWAVYGLLRTEEALGDIGPAAITGSLVAFTTVLLFLAVVDYSLIAHFVRRGPEEDVLTLGARTLPAPEPGTATRLSPEKPEKPEREETSWTSSGY